MTAAAPWLELRGERREKILVINCGSSSLKYSFYDTEDSALHARGSVERIRIDGTKIEHRGPAGVTTRRLQTAGFKEAFAEMLRELLRPPTPLLDSMNDLTMIVHRVVHGGERFTGATLITEETLADMEAVTLLAPLHNPVNLAGIRHMRGLLPAITQLAVFDTAFHHDLPSRAFLYGLPYELYVRRGVRRYGFHGASHHYVALCAAQFAGTPGRKLRVISCHLGNGSSLCALRDGRSLDTSMGFTPGEGLIMGTRCGDLDSGAVTFLQRTENLSAPDMERLLNEKSGLLGLSGISSDMRDIMKAAHGGHAQATRALHAYCYRVRKYIGSYVAALGGADVVAFTGGIGEGSADVRALSVEGLDSMGIVLDSGLNSAALSPREVCAISGYSSKATVLVVPADEERMMAFEALRVLHERGPVKARRRSMYARPG
jgi:acetate kinase